MYNTTWIICKQRSGWYWGEQARGLNIILPESGVGPFSTAADAALDMLRTWTVQSANRGRSN